MDADEINRLAASHHDYLVATRRHLHQHPELSSEERETAAFIAGELRSLGLDPQERVGGGYGVTATFEGGRPGPTLGFVADIDALPFDESNDLPFRSRTPGVMHACGHDANTAVLLAFAKALAAVQQDVPGRVRFIFEPAEETPPGGALGLIEGGCLDGVDAIFGVHQGPSDAGQLHLTPGPILASVDTFRITLLGRAGHAAEPQDAVDAVQIAGQVITALHHLVSRRVSPLQPALLGIGTVNGGVRENVIADEVTLTGTVRTMDPGVRQDLEHQIRRVVQGLTDTWGGGHRIDYAHGYPVLVNDPHMTTVGRRAAELVLEPSAVVTGGWPPGMPADDFSRYLELVPGAYAGLGVGTPGSAARPIIHSSDYLMDESGLSAGVAWYLALVMHFDDLNAAERHARVAGSGRPA